jgi:hypothetical protein
MQFNEENVTIRGDLKISASGTKSLMQKEVLTQRLLTFSQVFGGNPNTAPMVNMQYIIREAAISLGLDPDKAVNDPQMAMMYAEIMSKMNGSQQGSSQEANQANVPGAGVQPSVPGANPSDSSGGGASQIGVGSASTPGETGFSASV